MVSIQLPDRLYTQMLEQANQRGLSLEAWLAQMSDTVARTHEQHKKQQWYQSILDNYPYGLVALYDFDLRYTVANGQGLKAIGLTGADLVGKRLRDVFPSEVYERDEPSLLAALRGETTTLTVPVGDDFFEVTTQPVRNDAGTILYGMVISRNITELKRAQLAQKQSIDELELAIRTAQLGVWHFDVDSGQVSWNPQMFSIYDIPPENFDGTMDTFRTFLHPDDLADTDETFANIAVSGEVRNVRFRIIRRSGEIRYINASGCALYDQMGHLVTLMGINEDITENERGQQDLQASESRYRALFDGASNPILVFDVHANIIQLNALGAAYLGSTPQNSIGKSLQELSPIIFDQMFGRIQQVLASREVLIFEDNVDLPTVKKWFLSSFQPLDHQIYGVDAVQVIAYDITERKQNEILEIDRAKLVLQLEQETYLAQLRSKLLSMISHELRTPLTIIMTSSELLSQYYDRLSHEKRLEKIANIQQQIRHLDRMLDEISMLSRSDQAFLMYDPTATDLIAFCNNIIKDCQPIVKPNQRLILDYGVQRHEAFIDANLMRHALINLLSNAIKYSPQGGEIKLGITQTAQDFQFSVSDQGMGIPPDELDTLFVPFVRAGNVGEIRGTGLGLAIVKEIANLHGGTVFVKSQLGIGSVFEMVIPATKREK